MPPPPRMHKPNATIILKIVVNSKNDSEIWKKAFHLFAELVESKLLMYNTLHFNQYSLLVIRLNIFLLSSIN